MSQRGFHQSGTLALARPTPLGTLTWPYGQWRQRLPQHGRVFKNTCGSPMDINLRALRDKRRRVSSPRCHAARLSSSTPHGPLAGSAGVFSRTERLHRTQHCITRVVGRAARSGDYLSEDGVARPRIDVRLCAHSQRLLMQSAPQLSPRQPCCRLVQVTHVHRARA
jgi:hypothetical protein